MPTPRSILFVIMTLCLTVLIVLIVPGLHAYPQTTPEYPGLSALAVDRIYLAAGYTDKGEEATIGDPGEQAGIGDPGEAAGIGDPGERKSF